VSATGLVTALREGAVTVTVKTDDGGHTAECLVSVLADKPVPIDLPSGTPGDIEAVPYEEIGGPVSDDTAKEAAEDAAGESVEEVHPLPSFSADVTTGNVAAVAIYVTGRELMAELSSDVGLVKILAIDPPEGELFQYERLPHLFGDRKFTIMSLPVPPEKPDDLAGAMPEVVLKEIIYLGTLHPDVTYKLVVFIRDGDNFDLDKRRDGTIVDPLAIFGTRKKNNDNNNNNNGDRSSGGGMGCDAATAGYGCMVFFAIIGAVRFAARRRNL
jgi:hypothetical protein